MSLHDDLVAAKALIDTPEKWGKGEYHNANCTTYCVYGAVDAVGGGEWQASPEAISALRAALPDGFETLVSFNDDGATTHPDIMALFDRAIAGSVQS